MEKILQESQSHPHRSLIACGSLHNLSPTVNHKEVKDDQERVPIVEVIIAEACVPSPINDVNRVGDAKSTFLMWPKHLMPNVPTAVTSPSVDKPRSPDTIRPPKYNFKQRIAYMCFDDDYQSKRVHMDVLVVDHAFEPN
ncbi:hypothetical protein K1719_025840 [Acacia pycnantha]|nr:hypothetical protein K1719_025840 [Acacia pycnantha]